MKIARAGLILYPVVVGLLLATTSLGILDALFLALLLELVPAMALGQIDLLRGVALQRIPAYLNSAATIVTLGILGLWIGGRLVGLEALGFRTPLSVADLVWTAGLVIVGLGILLAFREIRRLTGTEETRMVHELMPVTPRERRLFVGLSLCAGFGEETAYRGYAITALVLATGSATLALFATSATFGVLHAYQGPIGILRTALVGLVMGAAFIHTGSLWPVIFAHALIDVAAGLVLGDRLL